MKKEELNKLLVYTKSKKILRIIFLYNNEDLLKEVLNIYENLCNTNRTDSQKSDLVMLYIKNRKDHRVKDLICSSLINDNYSFEEHVLIIKKYLKHLYSYEQIINDCYRKFMNNEEPKKKESTIIKTNSIILTNKNVLKNRSNEEIHKLLEIYSNDETGNIINIIVNKNILENRNNYEHIKLLNIYTNYPYKRIFDLIINPNILKTKTLYEQLKLIDDYLDNPTEVTYNDIINSIDNNTHMINSNDMMNNIEEEIKIYKKKKKNK